MTVRRCHAMISLVGLMLSGAVAGAAIAADEIPVDISVIAGYTDFAPTAAAEVPYLEMQIGYAESLARIAAALDCSIVRLFTAYDLEGTNLRSTWNSVVKTLREICDRAGTLGVRHLDRHVEAVEREPVVVGPVVGAHPVGERAFPGGRRLVRSPLHVVVDGERRDTVVLHGDRPEAALDEVLEEAVAGADEGRFRVGGLAEPQQVDVFEIHDLDRIFEPACETFPYCCAGWPR